MNNPTTILNPKPMIQGLLMQGYKHLSTRLFGALGITLLILFTAPAMAADSYKRLSQPQPTGADAGQIEVVEIFWYGCPHCHDFEPYLEEWLENKPDDVTFERMPAVFRQNWLAHAKAYYTAAELDALDAVHSAMFRAIHTRDKRLDSEDSLKKFFQQQGVDGDAFTKTYNSQAVESQVKRALAMVRRYEITGVPAVIVNGKYLTSGPLAGSYEGMIDTINTLVERERNSAAAP